MVRPNGYDLYWEEKGGGVMSSIQREHSRDFSMIFLMLPSVKEKIIRLFILLYLCYHFYHHAHNNQQNFSFSNCDFLV
jgi:hypothetical protein